MLSFQKKNLKKCIFSTASSPRWLATIPSVLQTFHAENVRTPRMQQAILMEALSGLPTHSILWSAFSELLYKCKDERTFEPTLILFQRIYTQGPIKILGIGIVLQEPSACVVYPSVALCSCAGLPTPHFAGASPNSLDHEKLGKRREMRRRRVEGTSNIWRNDVSLMHQGRPRIFRMQLRPEARRRKSVSAMIKALIRFRYMPRHFCI